MNIELTDEQAEYLRESIESDIENFFDDPDVLSVEWEYKILSEIAEKFGLNMDNYGTIYERERVMEMYND